MSTLSARNSCPYLRYSTAWFPAWYPTRRIPEIREQKPVGATHELHNLTKHNLLFLPRFLLSLFEKNLFKNSILTKNGLNYFLFLCIYEHNRQRRYRIKSAFASEYFRFVDPEIILNWFKTYLFVHKKKMMKVSKENVFNKKKSLKVNS